MTDAPNDKNLGILIKPDKDGNVNFFPTHFIELVFYFNNELGLKAISGKLEHQISNDIHNYFLDSLQGNDVLAKAGLQRLLFVGENLHTIKSFFDNDKDNYKKFCKKLSRAPTYVGARFELLIFSGLLKMGVKTKTEIIPQEKPDFRIKLEKDVFIECTSISFNGKREVLDNKTICNKIHSCIFTGKDAKNKKTYASNNCALFIDWSNLFALVMERKDSDFSSYFSNAMTEMISETKYGSIALFHYELDKTTYIYSAKCFRIDSQNIDHNLKSLLDHFLPSTLSATTNNTAFARIC